MVCERIECLIDFGMLFFELSLFVGWDMYVGDVVGGGIVIGIG